MSKKNRRWIYAVDAVVVVLALGSVVYGLLLRPSGNKAICQNVGKQHELILQGDAFSRPTLALAKCDVIKVINRDSLNYQLNFGVHDKHIAYPGFTTQLLRPGETQHIDAIQAGEYQFHDHLRDKAKTKLSIREE